MDLSAFGIQNKQLIPNRAQNMCVGSEFVQQNMQTPRNVREQNALTEILSGNIPDFLRQFCPVSITVGSNTITYLVMPDYISIGSDDDYFRFCVQAPTAQIIADAFDFSLPTKKMVDQIWKTAVNKLAPKPHGPPYDNTMLSTERMEWHNNQVNQQITGLNKEDLTAGHKKDLVLTNNLYPDNPKQKVAIYGWHQLNGAPIQGPQPNSSSHEFTYQDYSQTARFICKDVLVNGNLMRIDDVFSDINLCGLLNEDGVLKFTRY